MLLKSKKLENRLNIHKTQEMETEKLEMSSPWVTIRKINQSWSNYPFSKYDF